jgi:hypothetical protein
MAQTNIQRRDSGYYYRRKIPADLLVHYGKAEIVRSLRTSKKREDPGGRPSVGPPSDCRGARFAGSPRCPTHRASRADRKCFAVDLD